MTVFHLVQHGEKELGLPDPGLTEQGREDAGHAAVWLAYAGVKQLVSSPLRRARETAEIIAATVGLPLTVDPRLKERMDWDGVQPADEFLRDWAATVADRDFRPAAGDSSYQASNRLGALLFQLSGRPGPIALVTHGGVTVDLLRDLLGDDGVPEELLTEGIPSGAITTLDGNQVLDVASRHHLPTAE